MKSQLLFPLGSGVSPSSPSRLLLRWQRGVQSVLSGGIWIHTSPECCPPWSEELGVDGVALWSLSSLTNDTAHLCKILQETVCLYISIHKYIYIAYILVIYNYIVYYYYILVYNIVIVY